MVFSFQTMSPCLNVPEVGSSVPFINFLFSNLTGPPVLNTTSESMLLTPIPNLPCTVTFVSLPSGSPKSILPFARTTILVVSSVSNLKSSDVQVPNFTVPGAVSIINSASRVATENLPLGPSVPIPKDSVSVL